MTYIKGFLILFLIVLSASNSFGFVAAEWGSGGSGDVSVSGTPVNNQVALWTNSSTIEGSSAIEYDGADIVFTLPDNAGASNVIIKDSDGSTLSNTDSNGNFTVSSIAPYFSGTESDYIGTIFNPDAVFTVGSEITIDALTQADFTITKIAILCDADPTTEQTITFKYNTSAVGYGSATTIEAVTTSGGSALVTSGIDDSTVPAGSKVFMTISDPDDALIEVAWRLTGDFD